VAVADKCDGPAGPASPNLAKGQQVCQRLTGMLLIAQGVADGEPWRRAGELQQDGVCEGSNHRARDPALEVSGDVNRGLPRSQRDVGKRRGHVSAELANGDLEGRSGAKRRLVE